MHGRALARLAAVGSLVAPAAALTTLRPAHLLTGGPLALALVWVALPPLLVLPALRRAGRAPVVPADAGATAPEAWTTIVCLGDEPEEVAATTVAVAQACGPTIVATTAARRVPDGLGVPVVVGATSGEALRDAVRLADTSAVLLTSGGAAPVAETCARAVAALRPGVGWVTGVTRTWNDDGFAPDDRDRTEAGLRALALEAGLPLWEPDATVVRREVVLAGADGARAPRGAWLRAAAAQGLHGVRTDDVLALRVVPTSPSGFWPASAARQRAAVADLAGAASTRTLPWSSRLVATALLLRRLYAVPLLAALLLPVLVRVDDGVPFGAAAPAVLAAAVVAAVVRAMAWRRLAGTDGGVVTVAVAALHDAPGSLFALPAVVTRAPGRQARGGRRPLVWAAVLLTATTGVVLVAPPRIPTDESRAAAALAMLELALLWVVGLRAVLQRRWARTTPRLPMAVPVVLDGVRGTTVDATPTGLALVGGPTSLVLGAAVRVVLELEDGPLAMDAVVRGSGGRTRLEVRVPAEERVRWMRRVAQAAVAGDGVVAGEGSAEPAAHRGAQAAGIVVAGLVVATSCLVLGVLGGVLLGYRPMVVRSESMTPTYAIGDVVVVDEVPVRRLHVGDVVSFPWAVTGDIVTHRVRSLTTVPGGGVVVETRGDHNDLSEVWQAHRGDVVGRVVLHTPALGRLPARLGEVRDELAAAVLVAAALPILLLARRADTTLRRARRAAAPS